MAPLKLCNLDLAGFQQVHRKDRSDDSVYGGVLAWVSSSLVAKRRLDLEIDQLELMWLEIRCNNNKFLVGVVYRQPNANDEFWQLYQESVESAQESDAANIIMIGDFNADPTSLAGGMLNLFCNTNNFEQLIGEPTRITEMSRSVLNQVVTNVGHFVKEARIDRPVSSSDHCTVSLDLMFRLNKQKAYT